MPHRRYLLILAALFGIWWVALSIQPWHRSEWVMENALVVAAVALLAGFHRRLLFSRVSYTLIFVFMCLHQVGAHYTYSEVPYDGWFQKLTGRSFNSLAGWERNHFDRVVPFSYGLAARVSRARNLPFLRVANVRGFWGYFLPLDLTMSTSMLYELLEWGVAAGFGGELGQAYLGTQGDEWDAHKDMALASLGALITMSIPAALNWRLQRDFAREWVESLRVKQKAPLGEDEMARMARKKKSPKRGKPAEGLVPEAAARSLLFRVQPGLFEGSLGVGFLFVRIQLRLGRDLFGFNLRLFNRRIRVCLFFGFCGGDVHSVLPTVDGAFCGVLLVVDGRLLLVAAHENEGGECEYYRYLMFHNFSLGRWCCLFAVSVLQAPGSNVGKFGTGRYGVKPPGPAGRTRRLGCPCGHTILADTSRGFRYKTSVPNSDKLADFTAWCAQHITGDEKGQAQIFLDRLFRACGHPGVLDVGGQTN